MSHPITVALAPQPMPLVLFKARIPCGFPSPATDYLEEQVDLNTLLIRNKEATFLFRVASNSMEGVGIFDGDIILVDRSITPCHNHIVLAVVDNHYTVKRLYQRDSVVKLMPEHADYVPITFREGQELRVWGVVTFNLRRLGP